MQTTFLDVPVDSPRPIRVETPDEHIARLRSRCRDLGEENARLQAAAASPWFTRREAADWLRCSVSKVDQLIGTGVLVRHRCGRDVLIRKDQVRDLVQRDVAAPRRPMAESVGASAMA